MTAPNAKMERFVCPRCLRTTGTDKVFADCEYCGERMVPMVTWVRRHVKNSNTLKPGSKETDT